MSDKLVKCKSCGESISIEATACPKCGAPNKKKRNGCSIALAILCIVIGCFWLAADGSGDADEYLPIVQNVKVQGELTRKTVLETVCKDTSWDFYWSENKQPIVEFTGTIYAFLAQGEEKYYKLQFVVDKDANTSKIAYMEINFQDSPVMLYAGLESRFAEVVENGSVDSMKKMLGSGGPIK